VSFLTGPSLVQRPKSKAQRKIYCHSGRGPAKTRNPGKEHVLKKRHFSTQGTRRKPEFKGRNTVLVKAAKAFNAEDAGQPLPGSIAGLRRERLKSG